ncbi:MAG: UTP--glucose-1-phosphate uridylyltransferase [Pirellulales bacterium]|nr:UTP--glucose-1-phosphate uridylyltransferase [Pirellulales bacterium]
MARDPLELRTLLRRFGQEHLLAFWAQLEPDRQERLAAQIAAIDFAQLAELRHDLPGGETWAEAAQRAVGPPAIRLEGPMPFPSELARQRGRELLAAGKVGVVLVAGGQGTRLGFDQPKGMYPIGPVSQASLFQILLEGVGAVTSRYGAVVPLYLMTSPATHADTLAFLAAHDNFGLADADVQVVCQGTMPAVDAATGQVLLAAPDELALSPDGHGGLVAALAASGALADLQRRGITQLFYMQVDNPLVAVCDPEFLGNHLLSESEMSTQVVRKTDPLERVGNLVQIDGQVRIIEYSDLPDEVAARRRPDGNLELWAGNIAVHAIDVAFLARAAADPSTLPFHRALKRVPFVDPRGRTVEPAAPNAIKYERFIFDLLPAARRTLAVEVDPQTRFAPLKNGPDERRDTPATVRAQMISLHTAWLRAAGAMVDPGVAVEISPRLALDADQLRSVLPPGLRVTAPRYFC